MSLPLVKETSYCRKNSSKNIHTNNEYLCTAGHCYEEKNTNLIWKRDASALYSYSQADARVQTKI
jgi:hypothetical protein